MKKPIFALTAVLFAIGTSAFTALHQSPTAKVYNQPLWYYTETSTAQEGDRTKYEPLVGQDELCPGNSAVRCVIEAPEYMSTGRPDLDNITSVVSFKP